jgi:hypothetical protein
VDPIVSYCVVVVIAGGADIQTRCRGDEPARVVRGKEIRTDQEGRTGFYRRRASLDRGRR